MAVGSIVDYLTGLGQDSSYSARKKMADKYGIQNYTGTAAQNTQLLGMLQNGSGQAQAASAPQAPAGVAAGQDLTGNGLTVTESGKTTTNTRNYKRSDAVNDLYNRALRSADSIPDEYDPSEAVLGYRRRLKNLEADQPDAFVSRYDDQINGLLESILNEDPFHYNGQDLMNDDLYKMYADIYQRNARLAMQDAAGNAAGLTGGYGSTYSQAAGQQAYDAQMANLNQIALELSDRAWDRYQADRSNRYNQMGVLTNLDDRDYGKYRDEVGDWKDLLNYYAGRYDSEYARDYGAYRDMVADAQNMRDYWSGMYDMERDNDFSEYGSDLSESQWERQYALQEQAAAREAEEWDLRKQLLQRQIANAGRSGGGSSKSEKESDSKTMTQDDFNAGYNTIYAAAIRKAQEEDGLPVSEAIAVARETADEYLEDLKKKGVKVTAPEYKNATDLRRAEREAMQKAGLKVNWR